jgi:hypothetical protein
MAAQLKETFTKFGQGHLFQYWDSLNQEQQDSLLTQLQAIDPERVNAIFAKATGESKGRESGGTFDRHWHPMRPFITISGQTSHGPVATGLFSKLGHGFA